MNHDECPHFGRPAMRKDAVDLLNDQLTVARNELAAYQSMAEAQIETLEIVISRLRTICDAAFSLVREDAGPDDCTDEGEYARAAWDALVTALDDANYEDAGDINRALDEIDALRLKLAWTEQLARDRGEENERMRPVVVAAIAWADAEDETITSDLQDSTDALWSAVDAFRDPCGLDCELDATGIVHRPMCARWEP